MPELDGTLGAAFLGLLAAAILYGVTSVQTFIYFHDSQNDTRLLKATSPTPRDQFLGRSWFRLRIESSRTGFKRTDSILKFLMAFSINTASLNTRGALRSQTSDMSTETRPISTQIAFHSVELASTSSTINRKSDILNLE
ncbi:hypothetical protein CVT26_008379 [Gymnopilus dilepis]|uniref:Uncharacterized protein n=1 Tax=Gymnopilus dilepis TaxID=231916 RepID=A0A409XY69_9AGAR|nr:hypothetical protein CVT26_008379 [Gymnopilus dilepis]